MAKAPITSRGMKPTTIKPHLIAIDWGTSNFRAFLLDHEGTILETRFARQGLLKVARGDFSAALKKEIGDCLHYSPKVPILMCGMVGSRQGWQETPYLHCPLPLKNLANGLQLVSSYKYLWIVPGIRVDHADGRVDVMRGEETQIFGALNTQSAESQLFCLPGTHSKWARMEKGKLLDFSTFMTGELFTLLMKHSILGKPVRYVQPDAAAFEQGMLWSERQEHVLSQLFQVRTQMLANKLSFNGIHSFLSGLLIGQEVRAMLPQCARSEAIVIIANQRIAQLYAQVLQHYHHKAIVMDVNAVTARGLFKIAKQANIL